MGERVYVSHDSDIRVIQLSEKMTEYGLENKIRKGRIERSGKPHQSIRQTTRPKIKDGDIHPMKEISVSVHSSIT